MDVEEVQSEKTHSVENVWLLDPTSIDNVGEDQDASVEPCSCHL
jgi:hypothetical protein